jgi:uncharacterized protein YnzC (UPF0291/DUF896 family)
VVHVITDEKIKRINALSKKSKQEGLTDGEKEEQRILRQEYIDAMKQSLRNQLDTIKIVDEDDKGNPVQ